jgi:xanthine dehydrogenase iron-sulfur cluster and FAD-binding subunit A
LVNFRLNGRAVAVQNGTTLLKYLREVEKLTSVKNGCDEGVCGSCTVLIDGKAVRSCTMKVDKLQDKEVLTVEGLSGFERDVYSNAFAEAGIEVTFQDYRHPTYPQLHGEFVSHLSVVDLLFNCGPDSYEVIMSGQPQRLPASLS